MLKNSNYFFLLLLVLSVITPKWILSEIYFDNSFLVNTLINIKDIQYIPIIINFSDFNVNPSYLENINNNKILSFPTYGILIHSLFYKILGIYSFLFLEIALQFIFLVIFFKCIEKILNDSNYSFIFCILLFLFIALLEISLSFGNNRYLQFLYTNLNENLGTRLPRPLFTGMVYFYFFFILYSFKENILKFRLKYLILICFLLSVFLNSFFYYFVNFSILIFFLLIINEKNNFKKILLNNKFKILIALSSFIIFSSPFLIQLFIGEEDYSERIGVIQVNFDQKLFLIKYYFLNLFRFESLTLIIPAFIIHFYLNNKYYHLHEQINKINIFFYFVLVSIISPPIFFLISPKLISIYHFLGVLIFILVFYLILSFAFLFFQFIKINENSKNKNLLKIILIFVLFFSNMYLAKKMVKSNHNQFAEVNKIQNFLKETNYINTNKKLFTDDLKIMNLWLLNGNTQLSISDGFTNSLRNKDIEFNLVNNLKSFGISSSELGDILSVGKSEFRNSLLMTLFIYRYQANSLYTYSDIKNYTESLKDKIYKTSPFRAQSQIMPEDEKKRIIKLFNEIEVDKKNISDLIILNKKNSLKKLKIYNSKYKLVYTGEVYDIYINP